MRWLAWVAVSAVIGMACAEADNYVYSARKYDALAGCLDPYRSIDVVSGGEVSSTCAPLCFTYGTDIYTSRVCPPLPDTAVLLDPDSGACLAAVGLYDTTCGVDAGDAGAGAGGDDDDAGHDADVLDAGDADG